MRSSERARGEMADLAAQMLPRVQREATRIARRLPSHVPIGDLVSAGLEGLVDALAHLDPARCGAEAYVKRRVRGAIFDELRRRDPLTRDQRAFVRRVERVSRELTSRHGAPPGQREVAAALGVELEELRDRLTDAHHASTCGEAEALDAHEDELQGASHQRPDEVTERTEAHGALARAMGELPQRHRDVLRMHYHQGMTLREIGRALGVTESRVSQVHSEATARLRALLTAG